MVFKAFSLFRAPILFCFATITLIALALFPTPASGHGHMKRPLTRGSLWLDPTFTSRVPTHPNHGEVWCGNAPQDLDYSACGRCGDPIGEHNHTHGGMYGNGYIPSHAHYHAGSIIEVEAEFFWAHYGFYQIDLCADAEETDSCFQPLTIVGGSQTVSEDGRRICVPFDGRPKYVIARVQLPPGVRCERCTLRWTYRGATVYGTVWPGHPEFNPCYNAQPSQTFRNCADISIY